MNRNESWGDLSGEITRELARTYFHYADEKELQEGFALVLDGLGLRYEREFRLTNSDILDFAVLPRNVTDFGGDPVLAVELKVAGTATALVRQVYRYAGFDRVGAVLVVSTRAKHGDLPTSLLGKPMFTHLIRSGL